MRYLEVGEGGIFCHIPDRLFRRADSCWALYCFQPNPLGELVALFEVTCNTGSIF